MPSEPLQQRVLVEASSAVSSAAPQRQTVILPPPVAPQPVLDGQSTEALVGRQPQPVQEGLSGSTLVVQENPAPTGTAEATNTKQEEAQVAGFKAYSKARKAPLIAVDANTQDTASDAAPPALQPDAHKQCTTPRAGSMVVLLGTSTLFMPHLCRRLQQPMPIGDVWALPLDTHCFLLCRLSASTSGKSAG